MLSYISLTDVSGQHLLIPSDQLVLIWRPVSLGGRDVVNLILRHDRQDIPLINGMTPGEAHRLREAMYLGLGCMPDDWTGVLDLLTASRLEVQHTCEPTPKPVAAPVHPHTHGLDAPRRMPTHVAQRAVVTGEVS